MPSDVFLEN